LSYSTTMLGYLPAHVSNVSVSSADRMRVRRCLFGPVNHEELQATLRKETEEVRKNDEHTWNFDFITETPKQGRWEWYPVSSSTSDNSSSRKRQRDCSDEAAAQDVKRCKQDSGSEHIPGQHVDFSKVFTPITVVKDNTSEESSELIISDSSSGSSNIVSSQRKMTDFFVQRKKLLESPKKQSVHSSPKKHGQISKVDL